MAETNQAKNTYGALIFIDSVENILPLTEICHLQIIKSNDEKALTDLQGLNPTKILENILFIKIVC